MRACVRACVCASVPLCLCASVPVCLPVTCRALLALVVVKEGAGTALGVWRGDEHKGDNGRLRNSNERQV